MIINRFAHHVCQHWLWVLFAWCALLVLLRWFAPNWDTISKDGDFQYLPSDSPSVIGQRLSDRAFPESRSKSQIVLGVTRVSGEETGFDVVVAHDLARRFHNLAGVSELIRCRQLLQQQQATSLEEIDDSAARTEFAAAADRAEQEFKLAIERTLSCSQILTSASADGKASPKYDGLPLGAAYHNQSQLLELLGRRDDADIARRIAGSFDSDAEFDSDRLYPDLEEPLPIRDVWSPWTANLGSKLVAKRRDGRRGRLVIMHLATEFLAVENIDSYQAVEREKQDVEQWLKKAGSDGLRLDVSGSAAVGSDLLLASVESIRYTELFTVLLVTLILLLVYRSPLLVALPLIGIGISLFVALDFIALLTQMHQLPGMAWWDFSVYKTTRIFIVVILFGAGTDYCLFLVSRYREELAKGLGAEEAIAVALSKVGVALMASALTTVVGLGMMYFAEFGKLRNSGPAIAIALSITLLACLTLAPALLRLSGRWAFWPTNPGSPSRSKASQSSHSPSWERLAKLVTSRPGVILVVCFLVLAPAAWGGIDASRNVTYDMLHSLDIERPSRRGTDHLRRYFPIGEAGPVTVLIEHPTRPVVDREGNNDREALQAIRQVSQQLIEIDGVASVRSLASPLGMTSASAGRIGVANLAARVTELGQDWYVTKSAELDRRVTRLEVILESDAFSLEANRCVDKIDAKLRELARGDQSYWDGSKFAYSGIAPAIRDLRAVTQRDTVKIEILVVIAVFTVLLILLRRPLICFYMIATVLLSFYVTVNITNITFEWLYGDAYQGMDWKVPLFLFVILVAVGEDYNVYLASRVFEEQQSRGAVAGLRYAMARTGGIISSCGLIMAGTFGSMTSGTWGALIGESVPVLSDLLRNDKGSLQGIVQMGFALSVGVMLDTFVVRPILLPAFIAWLDRHFGSRDRQHESQPTE